MSATEADQLRRRYQVLTGRRCKCSACGEYFNSESVFDRHRVGGWKDEGIHRRCLSRAEMFARGWTVSSYGFWMRSRPADSGDSDTVPASNNLTGAALP